MVSLGHNELMTKLIKIQDQSMKAVVIAFHQAITAANDDLSLVRFCCFYLRAISQQLPKLLFSWRLQLAHKKNN